MSELLNTAIHSGGFWVVVIAIIIMAIGALFGGKKGRHSK